MTPPGGDAVHALALATLGQAVIITDLTGQVTYWNPAAELLYGVTASEAIGRQAADLVQAPAAPQAPDDAPEQRLSPRELEIVTHLCRGQRVPAIAAELYLSQGTVRNQLSSVYRKLGISGQQELIDLMRARTVSAR